MEEVLEHKADSFNGIIINPKGITNDIFIFGQSLNHSLEVWETEKRGGIWLTLLSSQSPLITVALDLGFKFHHTTQDSITLTKWLNKERPSPLPHYASHTIGVGGLCLNDKNQVLVVQEKMGPITKIWKVPGGMVDDGEDISVAVVREIKEETGIDSEFVSLVGFREAHHKTLRDSKNSNNLEIAGDGGKLTNLYFICLLTAKSNDIKIQETEIADCKWMELAEFKETIQKVYKGGVYFTLLQQGLKAAESYRQGGSTSEGLSSTCGLIAQSLPIGFMPGNNTVYFPGHNSDKHKL